MHVVAKCQKRLEGEGLGGSSSAMSTGEESTTTTTSTDSSEDPPPLISSELEDKFTIVVDGDVIVLDDVTKQVNTCKFRTRNVCVCFGVLDQSPRVSFNPFGIK